MIDEKAQIYCKYGLNSQIVSKFSMPYEPNFRY